MNKDKKINNNRNKKISKSIVLISLIILMTLTGLSVEATNYSSYEQGDDVVGSVGPATTLCTSTNPSSCSPSHFDIGTSAHIGRHNYASSSNPYAFYELPISHKSACIDDGIQLQMRYQVNDVFHRDSFPDNDVFVKLRDFSTSSSYDLLDSTVDTSTSSSSGDYAYSGTLDYGSSGVGSGEYNSYQYGHGTSFVTDSSRSFNKGSISGTNSIGSYLQDVGTQSKIGVYIFTNPGYSNSDDRETRIEVDWMRVVYDMEDIQPTNPLYPDFFWESNLIPDGPTTSGWYNSLGSNIEIRFGDGGYDACGFSHIEYVWRSSSSSAPYSWSIGTTVQPDNSGNSIYSDIIPPSSSGSYKLWWRAVDGLANKASWTSSSTLNFDYSDPNMPTTNSPNYWFNNSSSPTLEWSAASDSHSGMYGYTIQQDGVETLGNVTHTEGSASYTFDISTNSLIAGSNNFTIIAKDSTFPSSNTFDRSYQILFDPNPPLVNNNPLTNNSLFTTNTPEIQWSSLISYENPSESGLSQCIILVDGLEVFSINASICSSTSGNLTLPTLSDGVHSFQIWACDNANNCNFGQNRSFTVDATSPSLEQITITPSSNSWSNSSNIIVESIFSDQSSWGNGSGIERVWHGFFPQTYTPTMIEVKTANTPFICSSYCLSQELNFSTSLTSGSWTWWYIVKDSAGNEIFENATSNLTKIDILPPTFSFGPNLNITSNGDLEASWNASDSHSGVLGYLYALDTCDFSNSSLSYSNDVTFVDPGEGSHFICVRALDLVGNVRTLTTGSSILDTVPPTLTVDNFPTDWVNSSSAYISWSSTDVNGVLEVTIDSDIGGQISGLPNNGSHTLTGLVSGIHNITVTAIDQYGNTNVSSHILRVDTNSPLIINFSSENGSDWHNSQIISLSWETIEEHSGLNYIGVWLDGLEIENLLINNDSYSIAVSDGSHEIEIRILDSAGNSASSVITIRVDSATPQCYLDLGGSGWATYLPDFNASISANGGVSPISWDLIINNQKITEPDLQTFNLLSLADGQNLISLTVTNSAGTKSTCSSIIQLDRQAPSITNLVHLDRIKEEFLHTTFSAIDDTSGLASLKLSVNGNMIWESTSFVESGEIERNPVIPLPNSTFTEGIVLLEWIAQDFAGNINQVDRYLVIDRSAPQIQVFQLGPSPDNNIWVSESNPKWTWSVFDSLDEDIQIDLEVDGVAIMESVNPNWFNKAIPNLTIPNGIHVLQITATDSVGNVAQSAINFGVDEADIDCSAISRQSSGWTNSPSHIIDISTSLGISGGVLTWQDNSSSNSLVLPSGEYQTTIGPVHVIGSRSMLFEIQSNSGKIGLCSALLRTDTYQPVINSFSVLSQNGGEESFGNGKMFIQWELPFENESNSLRSMAIHVNGDLVYPTQSEEGNTFTNINQNASFGSYNFSTNQDGNYLVTITVLDEAGNVNSLTRTVFIRLDNTPPSISCRTISEEMETTIQDNPQYTTPIEEILCVIDDNSIIHLRDGLGEVETIMHDGTDITNRYTRTSKSEEFKFLIPTENRGIGNHILEITVIDQWGNIFTFEETYAVNGLGAILISASTGEILTNEDQITIFWNKSNLPSDSSVLFNILNINYENLNHSALDDDFTIDIGDNFANLIAKKGILPQTPGSNKEIDFTIDDGFTQTNFVIDIRIQECPSNKNLVSNECIDYKWYQYQSLEEKVPLPIFAVVLCLIIVLMIIAPVYRKQRNNSDNYHSLINKKGPFSEHQNKFMKSLIPMLENDLFSGLENPVKDWKIFQNVSKDFKKTDINEIMKWCLKHAAGEWDRTLRVYDQMDDGFHNDSVDPDKVAEITIQILRDGRDLGGALEDLFDDGILNYSNIGGEEE